jgi:hypothetical protein
MTEVEKSLGTCLERHWRCDFWSAGGTRCINRKDGHEKGHQFYSPINSPTISKEALPYHQHDDEEHIHHTSPGLKIGTFQCSVNSRKIVATLEDDITRNIQSELPSPYLREAGKDSGVLFFQSSRTCIGCLSNSPSIILPCGLVEHRICEGCAERFNIGDPQYSAFLTLERCPLGCHLKTTPWVIRRKPNSAGVRVLTLDGFVFLSSWPSKHTTHC